jgi:diaminopimelate decarboxylase
VGLTDKQLHSVASLTGTPVHVLDEDGIRNAARAMAAVASSVGDGAVQLRYAMKANSARPVLEIMRQAGIWIDAGSGYEVERAARAGYLSTASSPQITLSCDVFRDEAQVRAIQNGALVIVGSPGMIAELSAAGYSGPIGIRVNPGFGHGHVDSCDTGGPSSKHGIWSEDLEAAVTLAERAGMAVTMLHAHVGSGPLAAEYMETTSALIDAMSELLALTPAATRVSIGGGLPVPYRASQDTLDLNQFGALLARASTRFSNALGHGAVVETEPGRWFVAEHGVVVTTVKDIKSTTANSKGRGHQFVMVDAGFVDLIRPAMYGSWHSIRSLAPDASNRDGVEVVVAGPLCESGDVFTRDDEEMLVPRVLPEPQVGDLLALENSGAYGYAMSSNYLSVGRAPVVTVGVSGVRLVSRRESVDDVMAAECDQTLSA